MREKERGRGKERNRTNRSMQDWFQAGDREELTLQSNSSSAGEFFLALGGGCVSVVCSVQTFS